jgi:hypothetical protein
MNSIGFLSAKDLAVVLGIPESRRNAFIMELTRKRPLLGRDCLQIKRRRNGPTYMYMGSSLVIKALAARYMKEKSNG